MSDPTVRVRAYAKINLFLDVLGLRDDGFHDVVMLNQSVTPCDWVTVTRLDHVNDIRISCDHGEVPTDETNLVYKAALVFQDYINQSFGVRFAIEKNIPTQAGLAGGSADGAAALVGLNALADEPCTVQDLAELGARFGSDVPFCVRGGSAWVTGRGEELMPLAPPDNDWTVVLISPDVAVSTGSAYRKLDEMSQRDHPDSDAFRDAFTDGDFPEVCRRLHNAFERVILPEAPAILDARETLRANGAGAALMTGSGSNVFGLYETRREAESGLEKVLKQGWKAQLGVFQRAGTVLDG